MTIILNAEKKKITIVEDKNIIDTNYTIERCIANVVVIELTNGRSYLFHTDSDSSYFGPEGEYGPYLVDRIE